jgi:hypothetical protein
VTRYRAAFKIAQRDLDVLRSLPPGGGDDPQAAQPVGLEMMVLTAVADGHVGVVHPVHRLDQLLDRPAFAIR